MTATRTRKTADERRVDVLAAAIALFGEHGYDATSTELIAQRAGLSQPYIFRLFGTKKGLFVAAVHDCFARTLVLMQESTAGLRGKPAMEAVGQAYTQWITNDPGYLRFQLQIYGSSKADPEIRAAARDGYGALVGFVETLDPEDGTESVSRFFATGMLLNVMASLDLFASPLPWGDRLIAGCSTTLEEDQEYLS